VGEDVLLHGQDVEKRAHADLLPRMFDRERALGRDDRLLEGLDRCRGADHAGEPRLPPGTARLRRALSRSWRDLSSSAVASRTRESTESAQVDRHGQLQPDDRRALVAPDIGVDRRVRALRRVAADQVERRVMAGPGTLDLEPGDFQVVLGDADVEFSFSARSTQKSAELGSGSSAGSRAPASSARSGRGR